MQILRRLFSRASTSSQKKMNSKAFRGCLIVANLSIPQCTYYRVEQKTALLEKLHCPVTIVDWQDEEAVSNALTAHDMVIFYRIPASPPVIQWIRYAQEHGMQHFWETDDYIFDPLNKGDLATETSASDRDLQRRRSTLYLAALKLCGHTISSTPELARHMLEAGARSAHVIENALGEDTLHLASSFSTQRTSLQDGIIRIAFSAGSRSHDINLAYIAPALAQVMKEKANVELLTIGHVELPDELKPFNTRIKTLPFSHYEDYLCRLNTCDFLIIPLLDSPFNLCKSNIKFLEAAALQLPVIASPIPAYCSIITSGKNGFIASTQEEWISAMQQLAEDVNLRKNMGQQAKEAALANYSAQHIANTQVATLLTNLDINTHPDTTASCDDAKALSASIHASLVRRTLFAPYLNIQTDANWIRHIEAHKRQLDALAKASPCDHLISIILPTYNRAELLGQAIESVLQQHYRNWELLIIDDASTDNTEKVVSGYPDERIFYEKLTQNAGAGSARNHGLEKARGDYICYLDSDNQFLPGFLHIMLYSLHTAPRYSLAYCAQQCETRGKGDAIGDSFIRFFPYHRPTLEHDNYIDLGCIMHKRELVDEFGKFLPQMTGLEDWELLLRYTSKKPALAVPAILTYYLYGHSENQRNRSHDREESMSCIKHAAFGRSLSQDMPKVHLARAAEIFSLPSNPPKPKSQKPVAIFIIGHTSLDILQRSIEVLRHFTKDYSYQLHVLNDDANSLSIEAKAWLKQENISLTEGTPSNTFAASFINAAEHKQDIVLLHANALVTNGWLDGLQHAAEQLAQSDLIIPRQTRLSGDKDIAEHQPLCSPQRECDISLSARYANIDTFLDDKYGFVGLTSVTRFCLYIPYEKLAGVMSKIDLFAPEPLQRKGSLTFAYTPHSKLYHSPV